MYIYISVYLRVYVGVVPRLGISNELGGFAWEGEISGGEFATWLPMRNCVQYFCRVFDFN